VPAAPVLIITTPIVKLIFSIAFEHVSPCMDRTSCTETVLITKSKNNTSVLFFMSGFFLKVSSRIDSIKREKNRPVKVINMQN
jgi:hypothetical protein